MTVDHIHHVDHAVVNPHTMTTEYRCRCHKVLVTVAPDDITAEPAFAVYATRLQRINTERSES